MAHKGTKAIWPGFHLTIRYHLEIGSPLLRSVRDGFMAYRSCDGLTWVIQAFGRLGQARLATLSR